VGSKTILVVDDEAGVRRMLNYELTRQGYGVIEASDGQEALDMAREHHPDLITWTGAICLGD
jgi:DNA-binding response OmpR family regulator